MDNSRQLKITVLSMRQKRLLIKAALFPTVSFSVVLITQMVEYYFRFSNQYRYIYSFVSTIAFFIQLGILLTSIGFAFYVLLGHKLVNNRLVVALAILLSLFPLAWLITRIAFM